MVDPIARDPSLPPETPLPPCPRCQGRLAADWVLGDLWEAACIQCGRVAFEWVPGCDTWRVPHVSPPLGKAHRGVRL